MTATDPLDELVSLFDRARHLAGEVGRLLAAGQSGDALTGRLREQSEALARVQALAADFRPQLSRHPAPEVKRTVEGLRARFPDLVDAVEANHRLAATKGVRLAGVGGKPHTSSKRPADGRV